MRLAAHTGRDRERGDLYGIDHAELGLLQRLLLITDGTVTQLLATAMGEQIEAALLEQDVRVAGEEQQALELEARQQVLDRQVLLRGAASGRNYLHSASGVALERLPPVVRNGLLDGDAPIGLVLREHRVETFREILWSGSFAAGDLAAHFLVAQETTVLARRYRIWIERRPALLITETFPRSWGRTSSRPRPVRPADRRRGRRRRCAL